jgi:ATP-binding cassette, subfamily B, bacterial CvaB/MchF/RaxB
MRVLNLSLFAPKLRPILQTEAAECGVACLAMMATHFGLRTDLAALRARFSVSLKGATLSQLMQYAAVLELSSRPLRLEIEELPQLAMPCILHWDMNHFVVLTKVSAKNITILDPAMGERVVPMAEVNDHFTGVALELSPTPGFRKRDERQKIKLWPLMGHIMGLKRSLAVVLVLALALQVFAVISPLFMQWVVDGVLVTGDRDLLTIIGIASLLLLVTQQAIGIARSWSLLYISTTLGLQWTGRVFSHMMRLPVSFFEKRHLGDVVSRFDSVKAIQRTLTTGVLEAILDGIMAIITLGMMLLYSAKLAAVVFIALTLYVLLRWASYGMLKQASGDLIALNAKASSHFLESIRAVRPIKLFGGEEDRKARWQNMTIDGINRNVQVERINLVVRTANALIFGLEGVAILWLGASGVMSREMSIGMLMAFISYKDQLNGRISSLIDKFIEYKMLDLHAERLADIVLTKAEPVAVDLAQNAKFASNVPTPQITVPKIELRGVCFRYADAEPWVLRDINLTFEPGENVVIAGPSGGGKSTLVKLILGLLPPTEGDVLVDGVPISRIGFSAYRKLVGTVMQDDVLLAGSIADNITFFDAQPNLLRMEVAAKIASIYDEIHAMPMQFRSLVGDMGTTLSGGQKQRVLLARALYHQPKILVLDEATSHLDGENEAKVSDAIRRLKLTRISVAHRRETIAMGDRLVVILGGTVARDERRPSGAPQATTQAAGLRA